MWRRLIDDAGEQASGSGGKQETQNGAGRQQRGHSFEHKPQHFGAARANRDPNAELVLPSGYGVRDDAANAGDRQPQCQKTEASQSDGRRTARETHVLQHPIEAASFIERQTAIEPGDGLSHRRDDAFFGQCRPHE